MLQVLCASWLKTFLSDTSHYKDSTAPPRAGRVIRKRFTFSYLPNSKLLIPGENGAVFKQSGSSTSGQGEAFKPQSPKTEPQEQSLLKTATKSPDFSNSDDRLFLMTKMQLQCDYDEKDKSIKSYVALKMERGCYRN